MVPFTLRPDNSRESPDQKDQEILDALEILEALFNHRAIPGKGSQGRSFDDPGNQRRLGKLGITVQRFGPNNIGYILTRIVAKDLQGKTSVGSSLEYIPRPRPYDQDAQFVLIAIDNPANAMRKATVEIIPGKVEIDQSYANTEEVILGRTSARDPKDIFLDTFAQVEQDLIIPANSVLP